MDICELMVKPLVTLKPGDTLATAAELMRKHQLRHLPVIEDEELVGLVTERDILRRTGDNPKKLLEVCADEVMAKDVVSVRPDASVREAIRVMLRQQFGCLPVVRGRELLGIITRTDLLRFAERAVADVDLRRTCAEHDLDA